MTVLVGSSSASQTSSIWLRSWMAPTGQTAAHWPHCTQTTSLRSWANAGPISVAKPRPWANRPPTSWTSLHTVTQRRQATHLPVSRMSAGVLSSIILKVFSPSYRRSPMPRSLASVRSSQSADRPQTWQSPSCSESSSSTTIWRPSRTLPVLVLTTMPSVAGWLHEATRVRAPSTSTRQTRQAPMDWTSSR